MTIRSIKLAGDPKSWYTTLQGWIDDVTRFLTLAPGASLFTGATREFEWNTTMGSTDVALGMKTRPKGLVVLLVSEAGADGLLSGCQVDWTWRPGYARVSAIGGITAGVAYKVTIGVVF